MRCAIDSNLLVSSLFKMQSPPALVLAAWRTQRIEWISCPEQLQELSVALFRPKVIAYSRGGLPLAQRLFQELEHHSTIKHLTQPLPAVSRDTDDDFLFALFDQGHIDMIVSGDQDVLTLKGRYPVLTARELIDRL
jgi:putative PIN family toxin of toxin-antitoxin system